MSESIIWDTLIKCQDEIIDMFNEYAKETEEKVLNKFNQPENGWLNRVWANDHVRRAHIDVVDVRDSKGLWMMHVCCFPTLDNGSPIYGFDVIAGKRKMTGAFHDFSASSGGEEHPLCEWYQDAVSEFIPSKKRELPEWATNIFSPGMIAAGNVASEEESQAICKLAVDNLRVWFQSVPEYAGEQPTELTAGCQDYYCHNQQQNPHTPRVMKSLGLAEADVDEFCTNALFPKIA